MGTVTEVAFAVVPRTEAELAADCLWALLSGGLVARDRAGAAVAALGIEVDDLRLASIRAERRPGRPVVTVRRLMTTPAMWRDPDAEPGPDPDAPMVCRRCRLEKAPDAFPLRRDGSRGRWCVECATEQSERLVRQRRDEHRAWLTVRLSAGDPCVGMACAGCGHSLREGDTMTVTGLPRHEGCA